MSIIHATAYCGTAVSAFVIYDWLLCLGQEVKFIWGGRSRFTVASVVYAFSRYAIIIQNLMAIVTSFPMSDIVLRGTHHRLRRGRRWWDTVNAFPAFSALRAYALSNRNQWVTTIIFLLALPPVAMYIVSLLSVAPFYGFPLNCSASSSLSPTLAVGIIIDGSTITNLIIFRIAVVLRMSQFMQELLVVGLTWWYSYQSYRISKGISLGKTVSSLLLYNAHHQNHRFLAPLYLFDVISNTASVCHLNIADFHHNFIPLFSSITSIIVCRFMLSLRQFDASIAYATRSGIGSDSPVREHTAGSIVLQFAAQPADSLPPFLSSFAHPIHVDSDLSETDSDLEIIDDGRGPASSNVQGLQRSQADRTT
ncbi:hypothetical protein V8D89_002903 [Ganoderma adspersum]